MTTAPIEKIEPHKKFNTQWETVYSRDILEFTKEKIMEMCPKDVVDICMPKRDDDNRLMGPPIIKFEFEKNTLCPHIIIGEESIQLRMKKRTQLYVKSASN